MPQSHSTTPLEQFCSQIVSDLANSHKPRHPEGTVITISDKTLTITAAVDPVTVPMLAQPCKNTVATLKAASSKEQEPFRKIYF